MAKVEKGGGNAEFLFKDCSTSKYRTERSSSSESSDRCSFVYTARLLSGTCAVPDPRAAQAASEHGVSELRCSQHLSLHVGSLCKK